MVALLRSARTAPIMAQVRELRGPARADLVNELALAGRVGVVVARRSNVHVRLSRLRQGLKVLVERAVLLQNDHEMVDRNLGSGRVLRVQGGARARARAKHARFTAASVRSERG